MGYSIPILTYHSIDDSGSVISTSISRFQSQMRYLHDNAFRTLSLHEVAECIRKKTPFPDKSICITFDDGFRNVFHRAYPVLIRYNYSATIFLVPSYCGGKNNWEGQPNGLPILELLDWKEIAGMADSGFEFGAHTMNHADLISLPLSFAKHEIVSSRDEIQNRLSKNILFFSYPYGKLTEEIKKICKDNFLGSCSTEMGFTTLQSDLHALPRIDMYYFSQNSLFRYIGTFMFSFYISARRAIRSIKTKLDMVY